MAASATDFSPNGQDYHGNTEGEKYLSSAHTEAPTEGHTSSTTDETPSAVDHSRTLIVALHDHFRNKPADGTFGRIEKQGEYRNANLDPLELADHIGAGKAWIACHLTNGRRADENAGPANLVVLDIDGDITLEEFWQIPAASRHCVFTATSCSHLKATEKNPDAKERFRAVFITEEHADTPLHAGIYYRLLEALGLTLADNCGEKRERLWYGNDKALITFGQGEPLPWDWLETAAERALAQQTADAQRSLPSELTDNELKRCEYVLRHMLPPSAHGGGDTGYDDYWQVVLNAAASAGDALYTAFEEWSSNGDHHKEEGRRISRRWRGAGKRSNPLKLLTLAKKFKGSNWWKELPEELQPRKSSTPQRGRSTSNKPKEALCSERMEETESASPAAAEQTPFASELTSTALTPSSSADAVPSLVPNAEALKQLLNRRASSDGSRSGSATQLPGGTKTTKSKDDDIERLLNDLYAIRAGRPPFEFDKVSIVDRERHEASTHNKLLETYQQYRQRPEKLEEELLKRLYRDIGLRIQKSRGTTKKRLTGKEPNQLRWLIPGFIMNKAEHMLHAVSGAGKTIFALHVARAATGDPEIESFLDSGDFGPLNNSHLWKQSKVIFIASDMGQGGEDNSIAYIIKQKMTELPFLDQIEWWLEDEDNGTKEWTASIEGLWELHEALTNYRKQGEPASLVIVDAMKSVLPDGILVGQQNARPYLQAVADICRHHKASLLWIHHSNAEGRSQGIQRIHENTSAEFVITPNEETGGVTLNVRKIRGGAPSRKIEMKHFGVDKPLMLSRPTGDGNHGGSTTDIFKRLVLRALTSHFNEHRRTNLGLSQDHLYRNYLPKAMLRQELNKTLVSFMRNGMCPKPTDKMINRVLSDLIEDGLVKRTGRSTSTRYAIVPQGEQKPSEAEQGDAFVDLQ